MVIFLPTSTQELMHYCFPQAQVTPHHAQGGVSPATTMGWVQLGLAIVLGGEIMQFLHSNVHFASMIGNLVFKVKSFWTLQKTKCNSTVEKCPS